MVQKRVAAIHDISGVGKCSLTVAIPVISAAGIECSVIPTAVLSTHTGGFKGYTFNDLTDTILPTAEHWHKEGLKFDAIYSGYLGSIDQISILKKSIDIIGSDNTRIIVDPVMADNGKLYPAFSSEFPFKMRELCKSADIITPNITEACLMLEEEYVEPPYTKEYIDGLIKKAGELCKGTVVLTGVCFDDKELGAAAYDTENNKIYYSFSEKVKGMYHGTGDLFSSVFVSAITLGKGTERALKAAVEFTHLAIKNTYENYPELWYGVNFESELPKLAGIING